MKCITIFALSLLCLAGCSQAPQERHYKEIVIDAPSANSLVWQVPAGWVQGAGDQMRLVTFYSVNDPRAIDCSITTLTGEAGGLDANLERWLGQLGISSTDEILNGLEQSAQSVTSADGHEIKVFDLTHLQGISNKSMLAAVMNLEGLTVFIKMTGVKDALDANRENYLQLLSSIKQE